MRVLFVLPSNPTPPGTGNQNLTCALLKYMNENVSYDVAILADQIESEHSIVETAFRDAFDKVGTVKIFSKPKGIKRSLFRLWFLLTGQHPACGNFTNKQLSIWLRDISRKLNYDIVHFDMFHTSQYLSDTSGVPSLLVASDAYSVAAENNRKFIKRTSAKIRYYIEGAYLRRMERRVYPKFETVCLVSESDIEHISLFANTSNMRKVGIAVLDDFAHRPLTHLKNIFQSAPRLLLTGSLTHPIVAQGAIEFLNNVLPEVRSKHPNLPIVVLGRGAPQELTEIIKSLPNAEYIDYVEDYADFLEDDWIYVHPQKCGSGLQTKLQQALALGLPVLGYPVSFGGLELTHKKHAFVCESEDSLARHISDLATDCGLRAQIGAAAAQHVRTNFSVEKVGSHFMDLYHEASSSRDIGK